MVRPTKRRRLDRATSSGHQHDGPRSRNLVDEIDEGSSDATGSVEKLDSSKSANQQHRGNAPERANHSIESAVCFGSVSLPVANDGSTILRNMTDPIELCARSDHIKNKSLPR